MEDFVTWVDTSKLKRTVMQYNDEVVANHHASLQLLVIAFLNSSLTTLIYCSPEWLLYVVVANIVCVPLIKARGNNQLDIQPLAHTQTRLFPGVSPSSAPPRPLRRRFLPFSSSKSSWPRLEMATSKSSSAAAPSTLAVC